MDVLPDRTSSTPLSATVNAVRADRPAIEPAGRGGGLPLSFAQERLWLLEQSGDLGPGHPIPWRCRLRGALDREALRCALEGIVRRYDALRAMFRVVGGEPEQRIAPDEESGLLRLEHDLSGHAEPAASPSARGSVRVQDTRFTGVPKL